MCGIIFRRNEDSYFVNICILSDASGVCLYLGGLHGTLPSLYHLDLDLLGVLTLLDDGGGQLLDWVVAVASSLLPYCRSDAGGLCRKCLKGSRRIRKY